MHTTGEISLRRGTCVDTADEMISFWFRNTYATDFKVIYGQFANCFPIVYVHIQSRWCNPRYRTCGSDCGCPWSVPCTNIDSNTLNGLSHILKTLRALHEANVQRLQPTCALQFKYSMHATHNAAVSVGRSVRNGCNSPFQEALYSLCARSECCMHSIEPISRARKSNKMSEHWVMTRSPDVAVCVGTDGPWHVTFSTTARSLSDACMATYTLRTSSNQWRSSTAGNLLVQYKSWRAVLVLKCFWVPLVSDMCHIVVHLALCCTYV